LSFPLGAQAYSKLTKFPTLRQAQVSRGRDQQRVRSMKRRLIVKHLAFVMMLVAPAVLASGSAFASGDLCNVPAAEWKPKAELQTKLEQMGWKIKQIKADEGCYEVYGFDKEGKKQEAYFDPKTFTFVGGED
jgi:hypothetical protein